MLWGIFFLFSRCIIINRWNVIFVFFSRCIGGCSCFIWTFGGIPSLPFDLHYQDLPQWWRIQRQWKNSTLCILIKQRYFRGGSEIRQHKGTYKLTKLEPMRIYYHNSADALDATILWVSHAYALSSSGPHIWAGLLNLINWAQFRWTYVQ